MRRTTLGPVSQSNINSRMSMGGPASRNARNGSLMPTYKRGDDRRASALPAPSHRRSSALTHGQRTSSISGTARASMAYNRSGGRSDPRPLNDRPYMQHCVKSLISFVIERGYDHPISPKILTNPSSKDFQLILLFLLQRIDPNFSFQKRYEDEIPIILRMLGYPFTISKSALSAVGSPHTWPTLLGVLTWLYEILKYDEERTARKEADKQNLDPEARREKMFYDNMTKAYNEFLAGADTYPELDIALEQQFEDENVKRREEISKLETDLTEFNATLQTLRTQPSPLQLVTEQISAVDANIKKFRLLIPSLVEHRDTLKKKDAETSHDLHQVRKSVEGLKVERQKLLDTLARQEEAAIDVERIAAEREALREGLSAVGNDRARAELEQKQAEQELGSESSSLSDALGVYHAATSKIQLASDGAAHWNGHVFLISLSRDASLTQVEDMLPCEEMQKTLEYVNGFKHSRSESIPELRENGLALQESIDRKEEDLLILRHELATLESREKKLDEEYGAGKERLKEQLEKQKNASAQNVEELAEMRENMQGRLQECDERNEAIVEQQKSLEDQFERERRRLALGLERTIGICRKHKLDVRESIVRVTHHFDQVNQDMSDEN